MTDPRNPDDLGPDAFDGLGLESLTEGAHATSAQWSAITRDAGRRRQRRSWMVAAAALVVLVVGTAAVVLSRQGTDGSVDIASSGAGLGSEQYLIPPEDSSVSDVWVDGPAYSFAYTSEGVAWKLQAQGSTPGTTDPSSSGDHLADITAALGGRPFEVPALGTVYPQCSGYTMETDGSADTIAVTAARGNGPVTAAWRMGGALAGLYQMAPSDIGEPCPIAQGPGDVLLRALEGLRVVDQKTFDRYVAEQRDDQSDGTVLLTTTTTSTTSTSTTTTPTEVDASADPRSAEEQIAAAVADWQRRDASGSFVYLEDGTEKAAEYAEMFALAARQSGADQDDGSVEDTAEVRRLQFVTPERARFTIEFTSTLPTGQYTFGQEGEAILEDGRWVVTYRTVTNTLGRACLPPGGYDGCP
jgi:hypothetical protein